MQWNESSGSIWSTCCSCRFVAPSLQLFKFFVFLKLQLFIRYGTAFHRSSIGIFLSCIWPNVSMLLRQYINFFMPMLRSCIQTLNISRIFMITVTSFSFLHAEQRARMCPVFTVSCRNVWEWLHGLNGVPSLSPRYVILLGLRIDLSCMVTRN